MDQAAGFKAAARSIVLPTAPEKSHDVNNRSLFKCSRDVSGMIIYCKEVYQQINRRRLVRAGGGVVDDGGGLRRAEGDRSERGGGEVRSELLSVCSQRPAGSASQGRIDSLINKMNGAAVPSSFRSIIML